MEFEKYADQPQNQNFGVRVGRRPEDYILGVQDPLAAIAPVLAADGSYLKDIPDFESQIGLYFDTYACVTFSAIKNLVIIFNFLKRVGILTQEEVDFLIEYYSKNGKFNISEKYTATKSGTVCNVGNYLYKVGDSIRLDGLISQKVMDWDPQERDKITKCEDWYSAIDAKVDELAKKIFEYFGFNYRWVDVSTPESILEALKYGPIQVTANTTAKKVNGIYQKVDTSKVGHAITIAHPEVGKYFTCVDHYQGEPLKNYAWDFNFGPSLQYIITRKKAIINPTLMSLLTNNNGKLIQDTEKTGSVGIISNGKVRVAENEKQIVELLVAVQAKNGNLVAVKNADWEALPKEPLH